MRTTPRVTALRRLFSLALAQFVLAAPAAVAQTNGTLTGTTTTYNYSTAPWVITGGSGTYPDGGGSATFAPITGATPGTLVAASTVTFDVSPTLSELAFNTPIQYILAPGAGGIVASSTGLTINTLSTAQNVTVNGSPTSIAFGSQITASISGGGTAGLTKAGPGNFYLNSTAANTYTGGTHINGGFLTIGGSAVVGDGIFGAAGAGNGLSFNGGSVLFNTAGGLTTARDVFIDAGGATFVANTATTMNGVVSGSGTLTNIGFGGVAVTLAGANTHTGAFVSRGTNASLVLSGAGTLATSASYELTGTFALNNATSNVNNRISDTAPITSRGATITLAGNALAATSEVVGALTLGNGNNTITVTPNAAQATTLTVAGITRQNNATLFVRGTSLGSAPAANVANVIVTAAPALVGGGGPDGSTNISIVPWAAGNTNAAATLGSSLLTSGANGLRPLAVAEYATTLGVSPTDNVRLTAATVAPAATANALLFAPAAASTVSGGPITLTSGTLLYSPSAAVTGTVSAGLNFGSAEGVIMTTNTLALSGVMTGTGGVTFAALPAAASFNLNGLSTYTGQTTLLGGQYNLGAGTIASDGVTAGPFGLSTTPIVMATGNNSLFFFPAGGATINRPLSIQGQGAGGTFLINTSTTLVVTYNGDIDIQRPVSFYGSAVPATPGQIVVNGSITGSGLVTEQGGNPALVSLNGNNTYAGGTTIIVSTFAAGSNTAFGTGQITFNGAGTIRSTDATARTLANDLFLNATPTFAGTGALTFTGNVNLNGSRSLTISNTADTTFAGVVSSGSLTKTGTGTLVFSSPNGNTYTGGTLVNGGTLVVNNATGSGTGTGAVAVNTGGTLAGGNTTATTGIVSGAVAVNAGGRIAPGTPGVTNGIGTLQAGGNVTVTGGTGTTWAVALNPVAPNTPATAEAGGANVSQLRLTNAAGVLNLASTAGTPIAFTLTNATGGSFTLDQPVSYVVGTVATAGNIQTNGGTFNYDPAAFTFTTVGFDASAFALSVEGTNLVLTFTPVPEPGLVLALAVAGMAAFVWVRRRATRVAVA